MRYLPQTAQQIAHMLRVVGVESVDELFADIPVSLRPNQRPDLPEPLSETEVLAHLRHLGGLNAASGPAGDVTCFAGAGLYPHAIAAAVDALASRGEFATAYTPYQPELSQGTLTAIFEFQTVVAELFGTEYANASMYDGASAAAEALLMARRLTGRPRVLCSAAVHPEYLATCRTYLSGLAGLAADSRSTGDPPSQFDAGIELLPVAQDGTTDRAALQARLQPDVGCVVLQTPNFFGALEDLAPLCDLAHAAGALVVAVCPEPLALALIEPPGKLGADIVVGEGIGLASEPSLGGPGVGLLAASGKKALRQLPGRLVGETVDQAGRPGFVLTLATREQHIRRDKATSNICTNHGLCALRFTIHMALLGPAGLRELAEINLAKAVYARDTLCAIDGFEQRYTAPFFNEIALRVPGGDADRFADALLGEGLVAGVPLGRFGREHRDTLLVAVNETHQRAQIDQLAQSLAQAASRLR